MPKISVIVPVYKAERYIKRCIDSIINQSFIDLECILIDDGSPDNSGKICDEYRNKDPRIKVIHQNNAGVSAARNAGLDIATGDYIAFVDSDDYIHKDMIKENLEIMIAQNADVIIFNFTEIFKNKTINHIEVQTDDGTKYDRLFYFHKAPIMIWCKLYKAHIWHDLRFPVGLKHEDDYTMPYVVTKAEKIISNEKIYYFYDRTNENSIMANTLPHTRIYIKFLCELQKLKVAKGGFSCLYNSALVSIFRQALLAYNMNTFINFLTPEESNEIESFFIKYKNKSNLLSIRLKIYLWGYFNFRLINKVKGMQYYLKYKNNLK